MRKRWRKKTALAVVDACGLYKDVTARIRQRVFEKIQLPAESVMIMATHSHSAGPTLNWGEEIRVNSDYIDTIVLQTSDAIIEAYGNMKESTLKFNSGELYGVSFIRVFEMRDGSLKTNPGRGNPDIVKPACELDAGFSVAYVEQEDKPVGAIINFALHPAIVMGMKSHGDYISCVSEAMKKKFGDDFITLFINGACGNINHINALDKTRPASGIHEVIGKRIADYAISLYSSAKSCEGGVSYAASPLRLRRRVATAEQLVAAAEYLDSFGDSLVDENPLSENYMEIFFALEAMRSRIDRTLFTDTELQIIKIGDLYIHGVPAQIFCEFGVEIKKNAELSMVSAFANDYIGYVPTPECMKPGVYEARLASTSRHLPGAGAEICEGMKKLYKEL